MASNILDCFCVWNIDKETFTGRIFDDFLYQTYNFIEMWGINMVSIDIKTAVNDVERNTTCNLMVWPDAEVVIIEHQH